MQRIELLLVALLLVHGASGTALQEAVQILAVAGSAIYGGGRLTGKF